MGDNERRVMQTQQEDGAPLLLRPCMLTKLLQECQAVALVSSHHERAYRCWQLRKPVPVFYLVRLKHSECMFMTAIHLQLFLLCFLSGPADCCPCASSTSDSL